MGFLKHLILKVQSMSSNTEKIQTREFHLISNS